MHIMEYVQPLENKMFEKQIKKRAESEDEAQALISLMGKLVEAFEESSTEGIKRLLANKLSTWEEEWAENMNKLKDLL